ncbi:MAG: hypothetical protein U0229_00165 [Anaeromyxobacter sp.]
MIPLLVALASANPAAPQGVADPQPPAEPSTAPAGLRVRVFLRDGRTFDAELVDRGGGVLRVRRAGQLETYPDADVREVLELDRLREDKGGPATPAHLGHLHLPSAIGPARGALALRLTPATAGVTYGVLGWLAVSAGVQGDLTGSGTFPSPALVTGLDLHVAPLPWLHGSAGLRAFGYRTGLTVYATGAVTLGSPDVNFTLAAGPPHAWAGRFGAFDEVGYGAAMNVRILRFTSLVAEAWLSSGREHDVAAGGAARFMRGAFSADLGVIASGRSALPWVALAWTPARRALP